MDDAADPKPVAISFKEFRDEEIVEFFANEHRTFRAESIPPQSDFGRSRIVHASGSPRPTAAFRSILQAQKLKRAEKKRPPILWSDSEQTIPLSFDAVDPLIRLATLESVSGCPKPKRITVQEPSFGKPPRPLGSALLIGQKKKSAKERAARIVRDPVKPTDSNQKSVLKSPHFEGRWSYGKKEQDGAMPKPADPVTRLAENDAKLRQLIQSWPKLPLQLKETIATLVEVAEKDAKGT